MALFKETAEDKLKKAHVRLMKNRLTAPYIGAIMLGESKILESDASEAPAFMGMETAGTDGVNKFYFRKWMDKQTIQQACGGVLHENLHVFLKQIPRHMDLLGPVDGEDFKENKIYLNAAMDFVTNDIIMQIHEQDPQLVALPEGGLWDKQFRDWSVREVYHFLKTARDKSGAQGKKDRVSVKIDKDGNMSVTINGKEYKLGGQDGHDTELFKDATPEQIKKVMDEITQAIHQGGLLAGRMGLEIPRAIKEAMEPEVNWADETKEFVSNSTRGSDEYTWRKMNKRRLADDHYFPSTENEKVGKIFVFIDTSGSIGQAQLDEFGGELAGICELCQPEELHILWWDTQVHGEQIFFEGDFNNLRSLLKPMGGGGTRVTCCSEYMSGKKCDADCVIVFTDGYVEGDINWTIKIPTLWLVTQCESFTPPVGKLVKFKSKVS